MSEYTESFYQSLETTAEPSARVILPLLLRHIPVGSAVDIGCGDGGWLATLRSLGTTDILGIDGPWRSEASLKIPVANFRRAPLDQPLRLDRRFDLAISLEVAEHLPPDRADEFVAELTSLAPAILFSAAIPGQGGVNHFNEQWPAYWAQRFEAHSYLPIDLFRSAIWGNSAVAWWYKQNIVLYVERNALSRYPDLAEQATSSERLPALIHPEPWLRLHRLSEPRIGRWLRMAPAVLRRSLKKKRR